MKIAVNCWVLRNKKPDGIGYFTIYTISQLIKAHPEIQFQILCDRNFTEDYFDFPNVKKFRIFPPYRHPALYVFFLESVLPVFLKKHKPDILISMDGFLSLISNCRQIPVIYDLNFEHKPEDLQFRNRIYYRFYFRKFARKASRIATISDYSKQDIVNLYHIDPDKIDNISCGINSNFYPLTSEEVEAIREKWTAGKNYFFFVGSMHPRKNIRRLIEAFELFKSKTGSDYKLVLAGSILWQTSDIKEIYQESQYKSDIVFTGRLSDEELRLVLGAAFALSFVPIFEGFGLPIVEAMQCGVPVICSNVTSMPEVAGEAGLLVDPFDVQDIARGMEQLFKNEELRLNLIQKGHQQKLKFSWEKTAGLLWNCINRALNNGQQTVSQ